MRAVADEEELLARRQELGREVVGRADPALAQPLDAAGDLPVERVEELAPAGVDGGDDQLGVKRTGKASRSRLGTPIIGTPRACASGLGRGDADPQAGEQARARGRRRRR